MSKLVTVTTVYGGQVQVPHQEILRAVIAPRGIVCGREVAALVRFQIEFHTRPADPSPNAAKDVRRAYLIVG